jgi:hypothetical protein
MNATKHTPAKHGRRIYFGRGPLQGAGVDAESSHAEWLDAAQVAVETHHDLLAALRELTEATDRSRSPWAADWKRANEAMDAARAAIARATGQEGGQS